MCIRDSSNVNQLCVTCWPKFSITFLSFIFKWSTLIERPYSALFTDIISVGLTLFFYYGVTRYLQRVQLTVLWVLQIKVFERNTDSVPFRASDGPHTHRVVGVDVGVSRGHYLAPLSTELSPAVVEYCNGKHACCSNVWSHASCTPTTICIRSSSAQLVLIYFK